MKKRIAQILSLLWNLFSIGPKVTGSNPSPDLNNLWKFCPEHFVPFYYLSFFKISFLCQEHNWIDLKLKWYPLLVCSTLLFIMNNDTCLPRVTFSLRYKIDWHKVNKKTTNGWRLGLVQCLELCWIISLCLCLKWTLSEALNNAIKEMYSKHKT